MASRHIRYGRGVRGFWQKIVIFCFICCGRRSGIRPKIYTTISKNRHAQIGFSGCKLDTEWLIIVILLIFVEKINPSRPYRRFWESRCNSFSKSALGRPEIQKKHWKSACSDAKRRANSLDNGLKSFGLLNTYIESTKIVWTGSDRFHPMVVAGVKVDKIAKTITFSWFSSISSNWSP